MDVMSRVTNWVTGAQANFGLLRDTGSNKKTIFVSHEGGTAEQKPALQVCYTVPNDHCSPNPCIHGGTCENGAAGYTCQCAPGYTGTSCETLIDNCASAPCQNGGSCTNTVDGY